MEKKLDGNYTGAIMNKSWRQHPTKHQLYGHLPPITKTIKVIRTRHSGHSSRSRDELIRDVLLWTPSHGRAKAGRPARTYVQQLCADTGCSPEDLPEAMDDREGWRERVRDIRADSVTWWWWWFPLNDNHLFSHSYCLFGWFYGISTSMGYLMLITFWGWIHMNIIYILSIKLLGHQDFGLFICIVCNLTFFPGLAL